MKLNKLILFILLLIAISAKSQTQLGFKMGIHQSLTTYSNTSIINTNSKNSFDISAFGIYPINSILSVQGGATLIDKSFYLENLETGWDYTITPIYLEFPVQLFAKFNTGRIKPFVGAGGFLDVGVKGNIVTDDYNIYNNFQYNDSHRITWGNNNDSDFKRTTLGIITSFGLEVNPHFNFHLNYSTTLGNLLPESNNINARNRTISLGVGIIL